MKTTETKKKKKQNKYKQNKTKQHKPNQTKRLLRLTILLILNKDIHQGSRTSYTALCNCAVSHGAQN